MVERITAHIKGIKELGMDKYENIDFELTLVVRAKEYNINSFLDMIEKRDKINISKYRDYQDRKHGKD